MNDESLKHNFTKKKNKYGNTQVEQVTKQESGQNVPKFGNFSNNKIKNLMSDISDITLDEDSKNK